MSTTNKIFYIGGVFPTGEHTVGRQFSCNVWCLHEDGSQPNEIVAEVAGATYTEAHKRAIDKRDELSM